jgi:hypothetical protein
LRYGKVEWGGKKGRGLMGGVVRGYGLCRRSVGLNGVLGLRLHLTPLHPLLHPNPSPLEKGE